MVSINPASTLTWPGSGNQRTLAGRGFVVAVVQPQPLLRAGLEKVAGDALPGAQIHSYGSPESLFECGRRGSFDLVVTEVNLRVPESSLSSLEKLRKTLPKAQILALSPLPERQFGLSALRSGANVFLPLGTSLEEFGTALQAMVSGAGYISSEMAAAVADEAQGKGMRSGFAKLSPRELDVMRHLIWGMQLKTIASTLGLNIRTASCYKRNALGKLGMSSIAEVVRYSSEHGLTV